MGGFVGLFVESRMERQTFVRCSVYCKDPWEVYANHYSLPYHSVKVLTLSALSYCPPGSSAMCAVPRQHQGQL